MPPTERQGPRRAPSSRRRSPLPSALAATDGHRQVKVCALGRPWGEALLSVVGELDAETAPRFLARLQTLSDEGARSVIVDLGGAVIAAGGLDVLVAASALLEELNGELVLKSPRAHTLGLLDLAGLSDSFVIC